MRQVVVLHGWSDTSESFEPLLGFLKRHGYDATPLFLGDYVSLRDEIRIEDVARRMEDVVREKMAKPAGARDRLEPTFDLIVHSTGALVARCWIAEFYASRRAPVRNLVMLAPANFGSVLAHKGRSLVGRLFKGGLQNGFEVGEEILYALELGSSFQWDLAQRDLFVADGHSGAHAYYAPDQVRPFVVTGTHPYKGLGRGLVNENGSDGTVRVAAASLNVAGVTVDFSTSLIDPDIRQWQRRGGDALKFPLAVLPDRDHGNIIDPAATGHAQDARYRSKLGELILDALRTETAAQYRRKVATWDAVSMDTRTFAGFSDDAERHRRAVFGRSTPEAEYFHEHFQLVVRAEDHLGLPISDYFVEFVPKPRGAHSFARFGKASHFFHDEVLEHTHAHRRDSSQRCFFIDRYDMMRDGGFYSKIPKGRPAMLALTATATDPGPQVAYFAHGRPAKRAVLDLHGLHSDDRWLKRHCTHFIRLIVPRVGAQELFRLRRG